MESQLTQRGSGRELAIVLHGPHGSPEEMHRVSKAIEERSEDMDILAPILPYGGFFGLFRTTSVEQIVRDVVEEIDKTLANRESRDDGGAYERLILLGYSCGAVIARKIAIVVHGETAEAPFVKDLKGLERPWAGNIERIILLAGMSRGWAPEIARDWLQSTFWTLGSWYCAIVAMLRLPVPTLYVMRQGQPFIVQTRLEWLALTRSNRLAEKRLMRAGELNGRGGRLSMCEALPPIFVVQLLGAVDDLVSPDDAVDIVVHKGDNASFVLIEMPDTTHHAAIIMRKPEADQRKMLEDALGGGFAPDAKSLANVCRESSLTDQARFLLLAKAAGDSHDNLEKIAIARTHMADILAATPDEKTTDVVFVIHGIRDKGFWTHKVARAVKQQGEREQRVFRSFTRTYGYFAIFPFVLPWVRHWKTGWLMDHYVLMRALYPGAKFSYVGHSNGAYLLARALLHYPAAKFHHVVFVGSVVRRDYPWSVLLPDKSESRPGQIDKILNYVATEDWVVAIFGKALQTFTGLFDIGSSGYDGFDEHRRETRHPNLHEAKFVVGTHGAGIREAHWNDIARFIVKGEPPTNDAPRDAPPEWKAVQPRLLRLVSSGAPVLLVAWAILGAAFIWSLARSHRRRGSPCSIASPFTSSSRDSDLRDGERWLRLSERIPANERVLRQQRIEHDWHGCRRPPMETTSS
jgi:predicted esterase